MASEKLQIVLDADWRGKSAVQQADRDVSGLDKAVGKAGVSWRSFATGAAVATGALVAIGGAAKVAFGELQRGAELEVTASKFDNLTQSIGSTSEALIGRMTQATSGMVSNADLMSGAVTIMQGKLATTEDAVVRMSAVTGALGWDMGVLAQTINNQSVLRLDNLGLAVSDVIPRFKELQATMGDKEAFGLALIEAGEANMALLGDRAETTAGKIDQMTVAFQNARDAFSTGFAEGAADSVKVFAENIDLATQSFELAGQRLGETAGNLAVLLVGKSIGLEELDRALKAGVITATEYRTTATLLNADLISLDDTFAFVASKQDVFNLSLKVATSGLADEAASAANADVILRNYAGAATIAANATTALSNSFAGGFRLSRDIGAVTSTTAAQRAAGAAYTSGIAKEKEQSAATRATTQAFKDRIDVVNNLGQVMDYQSRTLEDADDLAGQFFGGVITGAQSAADAMAELDAVTGSYFDQARKGKDFNPAELFYEQALAAGASADKLREALIGGGLASTEEADRIYQEALQRQQIAAAAQAFAAPGGLSFEDAFKSGEGLTAADFSGATVNADNSRTVNVGGVTIYISGSANKKDLEMAIDSSFAVVADAEGVAP